MRIAPDGDHVLIIVDGRQIARMPAAAADAVASALKNAARIADEHANRDRIVFDHAILTRAGFPVGLTNRPDLQDRVRVESAWNREIRRYMPGGVKSAEVVGVPTIYNSKG